MTPATADPAATRARPRADVRGGRRILALLDYDGTVTTRECNEIAFQRLTGDAWRVFEEAAQRGETSHAECFDRQVGLVTAPRDELIAAVLEAAEPAPGLDAFLAALAAGGGRAVVVSAGFREAIEAFWRRESLPAVEIHASEVVAANGDDRPPWRVVFAPVLGDCPVCGPGACKGAAAEALREVGEAVAVFGDGLSDLCMARRAEVVFAKGTLARLCAAESIAYHPLDDFRHAWRTLLDLEGADGRA